MLYLNLCVSNMFRLVMYHLQVGKIYLMLNILHTSFFCCGFQNTKILLLPLALQPVVGFGLSNDTSPFFPILHQLSPSSHSHHLKISFYFFSPSFPGSSSSSRPFQFLSEDLFGHPILHSLQVTQPTYPLPLYPFYYIFSFTLLF